MKQFFLKSLDFFDRDVFHISLGCGIYAYHLILNVHWMILTLLQHLHQHSAVVEPCLCVLVDIRTELRKACQLSVLCKFQLQFAGNLFHRLYLSIAAYTGYRNTNVYSRSLSRKEQLGFQENLTVRDGNYICRDIRRNVPRLSLDNRQRRNRAPSQLFAEVRGSF